MPPDVSTVERKGTGIQPVRNGKTFRTRRPKPPGTKNQDVGNKQTDARAQFLLKYSQLKTGIWLFFILNERRSGGVC